MTVFKAKAVGWVSVITMCFVLITLITLISEAATYNFYFNNTEQGSNSTAQPALNVSGKESQLPTVTTQSDVAAQPAEITKPESEQPVSPDSGVISPAGSPSSTIATVEVPKSRRERSFGLLRFSVGGLGSWEKYSASYYSSNPDGVGGSYQNYEGFTAGLGATVSLALNLSRAVGLNSFFAYRETPNGFKTGGGFELEMYPVHVQGFGQEDFFELGFLLGTSTYGKAPGNIAALHTGMRFNFNFDNHWGVNLIGRVNLGLIQTEAGFIFRI